MIPWEIVKNAPVYQQIKTDWLNLLNDNTKKEPEYLTFLRDHAGFFSPRMHLFSSVFISELRLGSDYRVDFVLASCQRSLGFTYTLIEVESPHTPAFIEKGTPSARLTTAQQQIRDWKKWIASNNEEVRRIFPSWQVNFEYMIIIGRDSDKHTDRRNDLSKETGVQIRSFDYISELMNRVLFKSLTEPSHGLIPISKEKDNEFSNPFFKAYSDKKWRNIIRTPRLKDYHIISNNIDAFLENRELNSQREDEFKKYLATIPKEEQAKIISTLYNIKID